jgi:hypothetical protein
MNSGAYECVILYEKNPHQRMFRGNIRIGDGTAVTLALRIARHCQTGEAVSVGILLRSFDQAIAD